MGIKPLEDRILVRRSGVEEEVRGGIIVPDTAKEKPMEGEVVAVGEGKVLESGERAPMSVKVGDRILIGKYAGTEVTLDEQEYVILREDEVLGILVGKGAAVTV